MSSDGGAEEDMLDLDSPWVAAAEAQSRLEEAAMAAAAGAIDLRAENEPDADEIRDNQQRQDDEVGLLNIKLENAFVLSTISI
jgi:E3 ubiquitin-protein ligase RNF14